MTDEVSTEVEQIKQQEDVKQALQQTAGAKEEAKPVAETKDKVWLGMYLLLLFGLAGLSYLLGFGLLGFSHSVRSPLHKLTLSAMAIVFVLAVAKVVDVYLIGRVHNAVSKYNLKRILRLVVVLVMVLTVISILFQNWYTAVVSVGLLSLILGFALQTPITSFIGWIYILVKRPTELVTGSRLKTQRAM